MDYNPRQTVRDIHAALRKVRADGLTDIEVRVDWPRYRDLLILRGLLHDVAERDTWGRDYAGRPIKTFDGEQLILSNDAAVVYGRTEDGQIRGWAIVSGG